MNKEEVFVIGHKSPDTDSVVAAIAYAEYKNNFDKTRTYIPARTGDLNPETKFVLDKFNIDEPLLLLDASGKKIILLDHNEVGQVVEGSQNAEILEIIDHHKIDLKTSSPILMHAEPVGSSCTIIADFYLRHQVKLTKTMASLLLAGILSDTVAFKSPTTTLKDKSIADELNKIAKLELISFGLEVKKSKASITGMTARQVLTVDWKVFEKGSFKYGVGQIEVVHYDEALERKGELLKELKLLMNEKSLKLGAFMVTNIMEEATKLWFVGDAKLIEKAFNKEVVDNEVYLEGVMSRKKQVVPLLDNAV